MLLSSSLVLLSVLSVCLCDEDRPEVKTPYGTYIGHVIKSRGGRDILAFQGVPYAKPPVGKLRFKVPEKLEESEDIFDADKESADCIQARMQYKVDENNPGKGSKYTGSEDCLYLNIYLPKEKSKELLPVYFWIHGGGFFAGGGSTTWNGPRYLLDESRDMVMVAINYRLGILGFLNANDAVLPGNLGLKDQTAALKWVKGNIEAFGGDPNSITLGGMSAGAASVALHLNSKASKGLFHQAISQSGTADCPWVIRSIKESRKMASNVIASLSCPFEPNELLDCLQELPVELLLDSTEVLRVPKTGIMVHLGPVVENDSSGAFITMKSLQEGSNVPWLTGITNQEALIFYQFMAMEDSGYFDLSILKKSYKTLLPILGYYSFRTDADGLTNKIKKFYFGESGFSQATAKNFVELLSDRLFNHCLLSAAKKYKGKLYMYLFSYKGISNSQVVLRPKGTENGVSHGGDATYFFDTAFSPLLKETREDLDMSNKLMDMWFNFIKNGDPTPDNHLWEESDGGRKYLNFTNEGPVMGSDLFKDRMEFHDKLNVVNIIKGHDEL